MAATRRTRTRTRKLPPLAVERVVTRALPLRPVLNTSFGGRTARPHHHWRKSFGDAAAAEAGPDLRDAFDDWDEITSGGEDFDEDEEVEEEEEMAKRLEDEEDEKLVREVFSRVNAAGPGPSTLAKLHSSTGDEEEGESKPVTVVKRKADGEEPELHKLLSDNAKSLLSRSAPAVKKQKTNLANSLGIKVVKKGKAPAKSIS